MFKIMIIEDDSGICEELTILLKTSGYKPVTVTDYLNIKKSLEKENPDLVLLDIGLPQKDGYAICKDIRAVSDVPVIFITSYGDTINELKALSLGGDDYITKPYNVPVLLARISAVLRRKAGDIEETVEACGFKLYLSRGVLEYEENTIELTRNECRILYCLCKSPGQIVSRADMIEYLWDNQMYVDDNTLSVNITRLRDKLDGIGLGGLIHTKRGMGYRI